MKKLKGTCNHSRIIICNLEQEKRRIEPNLSKISGARVFCKKIIFVKKNYFLCVCVCVCVFFFIFFNYIKNFSFIIFSKDEINAPVIMFIMLRSSLFLSQSVRMLLTLSKSVSVIFVVSSCFTGRY